MAMGKGNKLEDQGWYVASNDKLDMEYRPYTWGVNKTTTVEKNKYVTLTFKIGDRNYTESVYLSWDKDTAKKQVEELFLKIANHAFRELNK